MTIMNPFHGALQKPLRWLFVGLVVWVCGAGVAQAETVGFVS